MKTHPTLEGVIPVICTPFTDNGAFDEHSMRRLVDFEIECAAYGITTCGLFSEAFKMNDREREKVVETVIDQVARRVPVIAGVAHGSTEVAVQSCLHAQEAGADYVMLMPPCFYKQGMQAVYDFYAAVAARIDIPIMVQDVTMLTGIDMTAEFLAKMANEIPRIKYIKIEVQPTFLKAAGFVRACKTEAKPVIGLGAVNLIEELECGAVAVIPGCGFTDALVRVYRLYQSQGADKAWKEFATVMPMIKYCGLSLDMSYHTIKHLLKQAGLIDSAYVRGPTFPLDQTSLNQFYRLAKMARLRALELPQK
ncbi:MAG: dihydrodipicolinate synthase family protein [Verrucomicrobia bacterium]|nr:dihydrodipicolinate synthase family protein [Verrucomicrobiota bacterium]